jgi:transcription initiation factor TFIIIB Brf1 subunit/transcription initiation factor TFIIB
MLCDECGAPVLRADRGEMVCAACGLVAQSTTIDASPITQRNDTYLGPGGDGHGPALSTPTPNAMTTRPMILTRDASGRSLNQETVKRMEYLTKVDKRIVSNKERSEKRLYLAVNELSVRLGAPKEIEERAFAVACKAIAAKMFRGWEFGLIAGGALYFATFEARGAVDRRSFMSQVLAAHENTKESNVLAAFKEIKRMLSVRPEAATAEKIALEVAARLEFTDAMVRVIKQNLARFPATAIPHIDASVVIYRTSEAFKAKISQRRIAEACGTTDVSLRARLATFKY